MINDISTKDKAVDLSLFADDSAAFTYGHDTNKLAIRMQKSLDEIDKWCDKWGFTISPTKSTAVCFTKKFEIKIDTPLSIKNNIIALEKHVKFLGMIFDQKQTWTKHIEYIEDKCKKRINLMKCIESSPKSLPLITYR